MKRDRDLAFTLFQRAAAAGNELANACVHFLTIHPIPEEVVEPAEILVRIRKEAEAGSACAQYLMGEILMRGWRMKKDERQAVEWFRKAAEQGNASAQVTLSFLTDLGIGTPRDSGKAEKWLRLASEKGNSAAQNILRLRQIPLVDFLAPR